MLKKTLLSLVVFAVLLLGINTLHFRFLPVQVVFYGALLDVAITTIIAGAWAWFVIFKRSADRLMFGQMLLIMLLGGYIYAISIPTVIDRSFSMYILEKIQQQGGGLKKDAFDRLITEEFMHEHHLTDARLTEQLASGTIRIENGCVLLTPRGNRIAASTRWYRTHLLPSHRLLMGHYTDALTDPFQKKSALEAYRCH